MWTAQIPGSRPRGAEETEGEKGRWQVPQRCPRWLFLEAWDPWPTCARPPQGPQLFLLSCLAGKRSHPSFKQRRLPLGAAAGALIIKAPLCVSGEVGLGGGDEGGAHKAPAAVCLQTGELSCAEGLKALIVFN